MSKSLSEFLFEAKQLTPEARRDRLEQLNPNGPYLAAAYDEKLNVALHNSTSLIGVSPAVRAQRTAALGKQIAEALALEFKALEQAEREVEQLEYIAAINAGWFPMQGTTPESVLGQLRADLERIRPKLAPENSAPATVAKVAPTEAEKLDSDRRQHQVTGEVTTRLLCDIYDIGDKALGKYLRNRHNLKDANGARFISTSDPRKFTPKDREKVKRGLEDGEVKRRQKQPEK